MFTHSVKETPLPKEQYASFESPSHINTTAIATEMTGAGVLRFVTNKTSDSNITIDGSTSYMTLASGGYYEIIGKLTIQDDAAVDKSIILELFNIDTFETVRLLSHTYNQKHAIMTKYTTPVSMVDHFVSGTWRFIIDPTGGGYVVPSETEFFFRKIKTDHPV